jgi:hypothetical protein
LKLHRLATTVAATTALVLTGTVPAIAEHGDPAPIATVEGNLNTCEDIKSIEGFTGDLDAHANWNNSPAANAEHPNHVEHDWWTGTYGDAYGNPDSSLDITLTDAGKSVNAQLAVLVKAGPGGTNLFLSEPGEDLVGLYGPEVPAPGKHPTISNYTVCKVKSAEFVPPEEPEEPEETITPEPEPEEPEGKGGGEPTETPAPVPTEIPAGTGTADAGTAGTAGLVAMLAVFAAGAAVIIRRRFLADS